MNVIFRIDGGRLVHSCGAVTANERLPYALISYGWAKRSYLSVNVVPVMAGMDVTILLGHPIRPASTNIY